MKTRLFALMLALCLTLSACGKQPESTQDPPAATYTVTVEDENGNPISGVMVQLCADACYPKATDANGQAIYAVPEETYKASLIALPAGYAYSGDAREFCFESGSFALTITLKAQG